MRNYQRELGTEIEFNIGSSIKFLDDDDEHNLFMQPKKNNYRFRLIAQKCFNSLP